MQPQAAHPTTYYQSIDHVLGPRETRFFGDGFRRVGHELRNLAISPVDDDRTLLTAKAGLIHPDVWSRKGETDQRPHLSTIDVLVLAAQLSDVLIANEFRLTQAQRRVAVLQTVHIKAGRTPVEQNLSDFTVTARITQTQDHPQLGRRTLTSCTVGNLRAECGILHPDREIEPEPHEEAAPKLASHPQWSLYDGGFRQRRQFLEDIEADFSENRARAQVRTAFVEETATIRDGLDATLYFAASPVDCFVATLQLGQLLLYQLDDVPRARSNTLWMRDTTIELDPGRPPLPAGASTAVSLQGPQLLKNAKGEVWRTADIVGELHGIRVRCSVAHRIPEKIN